MIPLLGVVGLSELAPLPTTIPIASGTEPIMIRQTRHTLGVMLLLEPEPSGLAPLPTIITIGIGTGHTVTLQINHISGVMPLSGLELLELAPLPTTSTIGRTMRHTLALPQVPILLTWQTKPILESIATCLGQDMDRHQHPAPAFLQATPEPMVVLPQVRILPTLQTKPIHGLTVTGMAPHLGLRPDTALEQVMLAETALTLHMGLT